jgi:tRNA-uridine 2-sulfurtransferase
MAMPTTSVLVAMSGGVDSSVAACLLAEAGHEVIGSHLKLVHTGGVDHGCCGPRAEADARAVAELAGFPFEVVDLSATFEERVIGDYLAESAAGRTPNPCVRCNERIKFGAFLDRARHLGVDYVATGHYVRTRRDDRGRWHLHRGRDRSKDQSYVLAGLTQEQLGRSLYPIGEQTKEETRAHARRLGLPVAGKPDSQELCFAPAGDAGAFLESRAPETARQGDLVDTAGRVLGRHGGVHMFTVG